jgi:hypothetical protein
MSSAGTPHLESAIDSYFEAQEKSCQGINESVKQTNE